MTLQTFQFTHNKKTINIKVKPLTTLIQKATGLMFKSNSPPLLFIYKKPTQQPIHSFFCKSFIAIWFNNKNQMIQTQLIKQYKLTIKPKQKFIKLLEIPENSKYFKKFLKTL